MEMCECEAECLLCRISIAQEQSGGSNKEIKKYLNFLKIKSNQDQEKFSLCGTCEPLMTKFSERQEKLQQARAEVNSSVQDICRVMLEADNDDGVDFGSLREKIVEKGVSLLEKALNVNEKRAVRVRVRRRSKKENEPKHSMVSGGKRRGRKRKPLPEYIDIKGKTIVYGMKQILYHCNICEKDFPSIHLSHHRRHESQVSNSFIQRSTSETPGIDKEKPKSQTKISSNKCKGMDMPSASSSSSAVSAPEVNSSCAVVGPVPSEAGPGTSVNTSFDQQQQIQDEMEEERENQKEPFPPLGIGAGREPESESEDDMEVYARNLDSLELERAALSSSSSNVDVNSNDITQPGTSKVKIVDMSGGEKAERSRGNVEQTDQRTLSKNSSSSGTTTGETGSKMRKFFVANPLPSFIVKKAKIHIYNQNHNLFYCTICDMDIPAPHLNNHKKRHGIGLHVCEVCGKSFSYKQGILNHIAKKGCRRVGH